MAEVLVASVLGSVLLIGSAQSLKVSLQSAQVARSILTENDFKASISQGLKEDCTPPGTPPDPADSTYNPVLKKDNLETTATDRDNGIGKLKDSVVLPGGVQKGTFKGDIEVVKMELRDAPATTKPEDRDLVVYYKKTGLGDQNTLNGGTCSPTDTKGCFYHSCSITYDTSHNKCTGLENCHDISEAVLLKVQNTVTTRVTAELKTKDCTQPGQYITGFDDNGNPLCAVPAGAPSTIQEDCPPGQFIREIRTDGTTVCAPACSGGRQLLPILEEVSDPDDFLLGPSVPQLSERLICQCPTGSNWDPDNEECVTCISPQKWDYVERGCRTCGGGGFWSLHSNIIGYTCRCPAGNKKKKMV